MILRHHQEWFSQLRFEKLTGKSDRVCSPWVIISTIFGNSIIIVSILSTIQMVTFICSHCDKTLKKKQCERHIRGQCRPGSLVCIDCSQTFRGSSYKDHTTCITQQEKHWGQYAKVKKNNQIKEPFQEEKVQKNHHEPVQPKDEKQEIIKEEVEWKGWKNEIKKMVRENKNCMEREELIRGIRGRYREMVGDEQVQDDFILQKIRKVKGAKEKCYIVIQ